MGRHATSAVCLGPCRQHASPLASTPPGDIEHITVRAHPASGDLQAVWYNAHRPRECALAVWRLRLGVPGSAHCLSNAGAAQILAPALFAPPPPLLLCPRRRLLGGGHRGAACP